MFSVKGDAHLVVGGDTEMIAGDVLLLEGVRYRVVGESAKHYPGAEAEKPGLEDGYVWLMKQG